MQLALLSFLLHMGAIFSNIIEADRSATRRVLNRSPQARPVQNVDYEGMCFECSGGLTEPLIICPYNEEHKFHGACIINSFICNEVSSSVRPHLDCRNIMRRCLVDSRRNNMVVSQQHGTFVLLHMLPLDSMVNILNSMHFTRHECECLIENAANFRALDMGATMQKYVASSIFLVTDFYDYLTSKENECTSRPTHNMALAKYFANGLPESQMLLNILERLLQRARRDNALWRESGREDFINNILVSPDIQLSPSDGQAIIAGFMKRDTYFKALELHTKIRMEDTTDIKQILETFRWYSSIYKNEYVYSYIWHCAICLYESGKSNPELILQIKRDAEEYLAMMDESKRSTVEEWVEMLCTQLAENPLNISEAEEKIREIGCRDRANEIRATPILKIMAENGLMRTIIRASRENRITLFQSMLDNWRLSIAADAYLMVPESNACAEIDLLLLQRLMGDCIAWDYWRALRCITILTQRRYFNYEMFVEALDIIFKAKISTFNLICIRLLLVADHRRFFDDISREEATALFEEFVRAKFFIGIALLEKKLLGKWRKCRSTVKASANDILSVYIRLPSILQEYIVRHYASNHIFAVWSEDIVSAMEFLFEKQPDKGLYYMSYLKYFMMNICGSEYFAENVEDAKVKNLMRVLIGLSSPGSLGCIDLFLAKALSVRHKFIAKEALFEKLAGVDLAPDDLTFINGMGFELELVNSRLAHRTEDGSIAVIEPGNISGKVAEMIRAADEHCLLELVRDVLAR